MGQGTTKTGKREYHHRSRRQQARFGERAARQASSHNSGRRGIRKRGRIAIFRDLSQDRRERARIIHSHCKEVAARPSRTSTHQTGTTAGRCELGAGGCKYAVRWALRLLEAFLAACLGVPQSVRGLVQPLVTSPSHHDAPLYIGLATQCPAPVRMAPMRFPIDPA